VCKVYGVQSILPEKIVWQFPNRVLNQDMWGRGA